MDGDQSSGSIGLSGLIAVSLTDTIRLSAALIPALLGFVATAALAVMASLIPGAIGTILSTFILLGGGSYFTLQTYGLALRVKQGAVPMKQQDLLWDLNTQIMAVWAGYLGWWLLFATVLTVLSLGLKMADANVVALVSWLPEGGMSRGLAILGIFAAIRVLFFWTFETNNAFLGVAKMTGGRDILFARSFIYGRRVSMFFALLIAALPLITAASIFGSLELFSINGLGFTFATTLPLPVTGFLGLLLGYSFILSVFIKTNAYLNALDG